MMIQAPVTDIARVAVSIGLRPYKSPMSIAEFVSRIVARLRYIAEAEEILRAQ